MQKLSTLSMAANAGGDGAKGAIWSLRICACSCAVLPIIVFGTFCGLYWGMLAEAQDANDAAEASGIYTDKDITWYDSCGLYGPLKEEDENFTTKWSVLLQFNAYLYLILAIIMFLTIFGSCLAPLLCCTLMGISCGGCAHTALLITTGVFRFRSEGKVCAENEAEVILGGMTYKEHADKIKALFIAQCVLVTFVGCCQAFACQVSVMAAGSSMFAMLSKRGQQ